MQALASYTVAELRSVLAYLNQQPYTAAIAAKRAAIIKAIAHRDCPVCQGTERVSDDIPCTSAGAH
jgi:hypothetical protein